MRTVGVNGKVSMVSRVLIFTELTFQEIAEQVINHLFFFQAKKKDFGLYSLKPVTKIEMLLAWKRNSLP